MWDMQSQIDHFGNENLYGSGSEGTIVLINQNTEEVTITGMGYAIGHYARWIDRGAVRIDAISSDPLVQVTAFRDDDQRRTVLVAINNHGADVTLEVNLSGLVLQGDLTGEQSTEAAFWQPIAPFAPATPTRFTVTLPTESVTTIAAQFCSDCPTDSDGNGSTAAPDLAMLLGAWGPITTDSACLDADGDGSVGAADLAFLLGAWGPCE